MNLVYLQGENEKAQGIHYEIDTDLAPLGEGGMGIVYRGVRVESSGIRRDVAVKFMFNDLPEHAIARARREASIQIHNENLVEMFGFIEIVKNGSAHYHVVSEMLHGIMLTDLLKGVVADKEGETIPFAVDLYRQYREQPAQFALYITKCVLSGVMALHDKGYVHRDIDPSNIMITSSGNIKLIDFGIAKVIDKKNASLDNHLTISGQFLGKPCYAAPELASGDLPHQNQQTDLYAIGIMLYQLIVGKVPFDGPLTEVLEMQIKQKMPLQDIPYRSIRKIVDKATQKKQSDRYRSAAEFRAEIEKIEDEDFSRTISMSGSTASQLISTMTDGISDKKNTKLFIGIAAAIALIVVGFFVFKPSGTEPEPSPAALMAMQEAEEKAKQDSIEAAKPKPTFTEIKQKLKNSSEAQEGLSLLKEMIADNTVQSGAAAALLASFYDDSNRHKDDNEYLQMKKNINFPDEPDYESMHKFNEIAVSCDPSCYSALYELACDYTDTNRGFDRDQEKAIDFANRAVNAARQSGATDIVNKGQRVIQLNGGN